MADTRKSLTSENPMRKIIGMLQDMATELEREGEVEKEIFDKAICACEGGTKELQKVIDDSTASIEELTSKVAAGNAEKTQLTQDVSEHKKNVATATDDLEEATMLRDKEHKAFVADEKDTSANIAAMGKAIPAIEKGMGGAALMQMPGQTAKMEKFRRYCEVTKLLSNDERSEVLSFLDQGSDEADKSQTQAAGEILGILKNMKDEMEKDLADMQAQETTDHEGYNDLKAAKTEEISINEKAVIEKEKRIGALALELSEGKHALEDAKEELANAQKFKATMKEQCASMEEQKAAREKARAEEIKAISEAVTILNDDEALETFSKAKGGAFVQKPARVTYDALLQLTTKAKVVQKHTALLVLKHKEEPDVMIGTGTAHGTHEHPDPAEKLVVHMIDGMVGVMHDEDVGDEHKKAWCANETEVMHGVEAEKKDLIAKTGSEIAEQEDLLATTIAEIKALTEKIAELDKMVHETTEDRKAQHQEFVDMFATSATAIRLVSKAITRLEKFYSPEKFAAAKKAATDAALAKAGLGLVQNKPEERVNSLLAQKKAAELLPGGFDAFLQKRSSTRSLLQAEAQFRTAIRNGVDPIVLPDTPSGTAEKQESG